MSRRIVICLSRTRPWSRCLTFALSLNVAQRNCSALLLELELLLLSLRSFLKPTETLKTCSSSRSSLSLHLLVPVPRTCTLGNGSMVRRALSFRFHCFPHLCSECDVAGKNFSNTCSAISATCQVGWGVPGVHPLAFVKSSLVIMCDLGVETYSSSISVGSSILGFFFLRQLLMR